MPIIFNQAIGRLFNFNTSQNNVQTNKTKAVDMTNSGSQSTNQGMIMNPNPQDQVVFNQDSNNRSNFGAQSFAWNKFLNLGNQGINQAVVMMATAESPTVIIN